MITVAMFSTVALAAVVPSEEAPASATAAAAAIPTVVSFHGGLPLRGTRVLPPSGNNGLPRVARELTLPT
jgi:hypothetical protein